MKYFKILASLTVAVAAMMALAASASATTVTTTTGGAAATPTIHTVNEGGHVKLANAIANIECGLTTEGKVESHGAGVAASGKFSKVEFTGCTNSWHVTVHEEEGFRIVCCIGGYAAITEWIRITITTTRFGVQCNYQTNNTKIGTDTGGNPATVKIEASIPIAAGSSGLCGAGNAKMEGSLVTTSALYFTP
jgi:hypothetical protein